MLTFDEIINQTPILLKKLQESAFLERNNISLLPVKGIYVFYEQGQPIYVGRSRNIHRRVSSHGRPSSGHNSATFAFLLAKERAKAYGYDINLSRRDLEINPEFSRIYKEEKARVAKMQIKAVEIINPEVQAIFEIYAAKALGTQYNDFDTH
jgi:hypothetical protein